MIAHGPVQCRSNENSRGNVSGFLFAADANARSAARAIYNERCITSDVLQAMYCRLSGALYPMASHRSTKGVSFIEEGVEERCSRRRR